MENLLRFVFHRIETIRMLRILALTFSLLAAGGLATDPVTTERPTPLHGQFFPENYNRAEVGK